MYDYYIMQMLRTQILLPKKLRIAIDKDRRRRGETLSGYIRKAALVRLKMTQELENRVDHLFDRIIGTVDLSKHPEWQTREKIIKWQRKLRREKGI